MATPRKKPEDKEKAGRPEKYKPEYCELARNYCSLGATNQDLARLFKVSLNTIDNWQEQHPEFLGALKEAKNELDSKVVQSLYRRAVGYEHPDVDIRTRAVGGGISVIEQTEIIRKYPPDTTAAIFWLKNRQRDQWRDRQEVEHSGNVNITPMDILKSIERPPKTN